FLGDPAVATAGGDVVEVDAVLPRQPPGDGGGGQVAVIRAAGQFGEGAGRRRLGAKGGDVALGGGGLGGYLGGLRRLGFGRGGRRAAALGGDKAVDVPVRGVGARQHTQQGAHRQGFPRLGDDAAQH